MFVLWKRSQQTKTYNVQILQTNCLISEISNKCSFKFWYFLFAFHTQKSLLQLYIKVKKKQ